MTKTLHTTHVRFGAHQESEDVSAYTGTRVPWRSITIERLYVSRGLGRFAVVPFDLAQNFNLIVHCGTETRVAMKGVTATMTRIIDRHTTEPVAFFQWGEA